MLDCLLDHKAQEHFFEVIDAPTLQLSRELLMRNIEKICQWLGMVKPEQMRKGSRHEDLKGDTVALAKLVMKEGEKPGKFLLPHGIILLGWWLRIFMEDNPYGIQNQSSFRIMELSVGSGALVSETQRTRATHPRAPACRGAHRAGRPHALAGLGRSCDPS